LQKNRCKPELELKLHRFSICRYDIAEGNVLTRLGDVLYWLGCILAAIVVAWGVQVCLGDTNNADDPYMLAPIAAGAFAIWTIGRACRYILSGK
jgi:hypothetical protein